MRSNGQLLTKKQLQFVTETVVQAVESEIVKSFFMFESNSAERKEERLAAMGDFLDLYRVIDPYTYLTNESLDKINSVLFTKNRETRRIFLNTVFKVSLALTTAELDIGCFNQTIITSLGRCMVEPGESNNSLISDDINNAIYLPEDRITEMIESNFWLAVLYILLVNFHQLALPETIDQQIKKFSTN